MDRCIQTTNCTDLPATSSFLVESRSGDEILPRLLSLSQDIFCRIRLSPEPNIEYISPNAERLLGYSLSELMNFQNLAFCLVHPDDRYIFTNLFSGALLPSPQKLRVFLKDHSVVWLEMNFQFLMDDDSRPKALDFLVRDVTRLVRAETSLHHTVESFDQIIYGNPAAITITSIADGKVLDLNVKMAELLGYTREELLFRSTSDIGVWDYHSGSRQHWLEVLFESGWMHQPNLIIPHKSGCSRSVIAFHQLVEYHGSTCIFTMLIDVSSQKQTQDQLEKASQISRSLSETLSIEQLYERLGEAVQDLLPDISTIFISSFNPQRGQISCKYGFQDGIRLDVGDFPVVPLEPPGHGTQSEAIHSSQTIIINDLPSRLKKVSKQFHKRGNGDNRQTQSAVFSPLIASGQVMGVLQVQSYTPNRFSEDDARLLSLVGNTAAVALQNARLFENLKQTTADITQAYDDTIEGWARALELRDRETEGHTRRVTDLTIRLAAAMGVSTPEIIHIRHGAQLHDIGKMGIPDHILLKPGPLSEEEWVTMRKHPYFAYKTLANISHLRLALVIPYCHHERWDGTGYPQGLKGESIPFWARIFSIVDVYDALTSDRPYRPAWPQKRALEYIASQSGKQFDPAIVPVFLELFQDDQDWTI